MSRAGLLASCTLAALWSCASEPVPASDAQDERSDSTDPDAASVVEGDGTWQSPFVIRELPYVFDGDTRLAPADEADSYSPCAPSTNESGGEFVFALQLDDMARVDIALDDVAGDGVDVDLHLLEDLAPTSCVDRDNRAIGASLQAGNHWLSVDTWTDGSGNEMAGDFRLTVDLSTGAEICGTNPIPNCEDGDAPVPVSVPQEAPGLGTCPDGMRPIDGGAFCIDTYEASLAKVESNGSLSPWSPFLNPGSERVRALSAFGVVPQGHISQVQATDACEEAGKRLCSNDEWLQACRGSAGSTYPYGDEHQDEVCNEDRTCHPVVQYFESGAEWIWSELNNSCINQLPEGLATTGEHEGCVSEEGALDMMGNLHEWTDDPAGTFRGGFYVDTTINGTGCGYRTTAHDVNHWDYSTGFRCCADL